MKPKHCPLVREEKECGPWCGMYVDDLRECALVTMAHSMAFLLDMEWRRFLFDEESFLHELENTPGPPQGGEDHGGE
jgi:hypothetical protein